MELRDSIIDVLDRFYAMAGSNPPQEMKALNAENWHIALEDIPNSAIESGFIKAVSADIRRIPFPGEFKKFCISRQTNNVQAEEGKIYIPESPVISKENARTILNKLLAMGKNILPVEETSPPLHKMSLYGYSDGINFSYESEGEHSKKQMFESIKVDNPSNTKNLIIGNPVYVYRKWGSIKEKGGGIRSGFLRCDQQDDGARILTKVSVIQQ